MGEENKNEKNRFCTSRQLKHRRGVMAGGAVAIVMIAGFLPDVTEENWYQTNQCCRRGMAGDG